ncbi:MAG: hypothetical protein Q9170_006519 [Blastenia crenularia]
MQTSRIRGGTPYSYTGEHSEIDDPGLNALLDELAQWNRQRDAERQQAAIDEANATYQPPPDIRTPDRSPSPPVGGLLSPAASPPHPRPRHHTIPSGPPASSPRPQPQHHTTPPEPAASNDATTLQPPGLQRKRRLAPRRRGNVRHPVDSATAQSIAGRPTTDSPTIKNHDEVKGIVLQFVLGVRQVRSAWSNDQGPVKAGKEIKGFIARPIRRSPLRDISETFHQTRNIFWCQEAAGQDSKST